MYQFEKAGWLMLVGIDALMAVTAPVVLVLMLVLKLKKGISVPRLALLVAAYVYVLVVARYALLPFADLRLAAEYRSEAPFLADANLVPLKGLFASSRQLVGNFLLTVPAGMLLAALLPWPRRLRVGLWGCIAAGVGLELLQFFLGELGIVRYRNVDINDAILNVAGALLGYGCIRATRRALLRV